MGKAPHIAIALLVMSLAALGVASADTVYSNLSDTGPPYYSSVYGALIVDASTADDPYYTAAATSFTVTGGNYRLTELLLGMEGFSALTGDEVFTVSLRSSSASGLPGTALETFSVAFNELPTLYSSDGSSLLTLTSITNALLEDGQTYWVTVTPPSSAPTTGLLWYNSGDTSAAFTAMDSGTGWMIDTESPAYALSVKGTSATPEPCSLLALGAGTVGAILARRRRKA